MKHKNSIKRIHGNYIYLITSTTYQREKYFEEKILCEMWILELQKVKEVTGFLLFNFCLNYDHFHLLIKPDINKYDISKIMHKFKRNCSQNINKILGYTQFKDADDVPGVDDDLIVGDDAHRRLQLNRHHQLNPRLQLSFSMRDYDDHIKQLKYKFQGKYNKNHPIQLFKWQKSFHDRIVRDDEDFFNFYTYISYNYKKHGLPEDWQYTGRNYSEMLDVL